MACDAPRFYGHLDAPISQIHRSKHPPLIVLITMAGLFFGFWTCAPAPAHRGTVKSGVGDVDRASRLAVYPDGQHATHVSTPHITGNELICWF
jgi:hypothetical protein